MKSVNTLNTNVTTPLGQFHVQTELYKSSNRIVTVVFSKGRTFLRIENTPGENADKEIEKIHKLIVEKLSLIINPSISELKIKELLEKSTNLATVKFPEECFIPDKEDELVQNSKLHLSGLPVPPEIVVLENAQWEDVSATCKKVFSEEEPAGLIKELKANTHFRIVEKLNREVFQNLNKPFIFLNGTVLEKVKSSGFILTRDPLSEDKVVIIESTFGIGGILNIPKQLFDKFKVDRETIEFWRIKKEIVKKQQKLMFKNRSIVSETIADERRIRSSLSDEETLELTKLALLLERVFSKPAKIYFLLTNEGTPQFIYVSLIGMKEKREILRKISALEEPFSYPTGTKILMEVKTYEEAKLCSLIPSDGILINAEKIPSSELKNILLSTAESIFPKPVIIHTNNKNSLSIIEHARERGFTNIYIASSINNIPPAIPSFKETVSPFIAGKTFKGTLGKLFSGYENSLSSNLPLIRELISSGFDFITAPADEINVLKKIVASEEKALLLKMARRLLSLEERI